ncbi:MAG: hypothetical protein IJ736_15105 [Firmicutes bacterium]|nr:hypothetical protein [Bacillota bacterium]
MVTRKSEKINDDLWERWKEAAEKDGIDIDEMVAFARKMHRRLIFVSAMDRLAAVTVEFIGGLVVGCLLT